MPAKTKTPKRQARPPVCAECGKDAVLADSSAVYGVGMKEFWGLPIWLCSCGAYVGCHKGTEKPLGTPAGPVTRKLRTAAHAAFDPLWEAKMRKGFTQAEARAAAYKWAAEQLGIPSTLMHVGMMGAADCQRLIDLCAPYKRRA